MRMHHLSLKTIPAGRKETKRIAFLSLLLAFAALLPNESRAAGLEASDGVANDRFGESVSVSGDIGLIGASNYVGTKGSAYVFHGLDTVGPVTENAKLTTSDITANGHFGEYLSLSGSIGLISAFGDSNAKGALYLFRNLNTASGPVAETAKLTASDAVANDKLGSSVSLSGTIGLAGAYGDDGYIGSAYVFRGLDTATGPVTEAVKLTATDGVAGDAFGYTVSLSGSIGLVGAPSDDSNRGSIYVFHDLDTAGPDPVTESTKLLATDGVASDDLGVSVSLSGSIGLAGADGDDDFQGAAYVFRGLDTATGPDPVTESAKLTASDGAADDQFGYSVSLSGSIGLVGAYKDDDKGSASGSVYVFLDLDTVTGTVTENVKLTASDGAASDLFGVSVSLNGDNFLIGSRKNSSKGKVYSGSVGSVTTLDAGNISRTISGIDFVSRGDWIIGKATDNNSVSLGAGSTANVTSADKKVYIGKEGGSDGNTLSIAGSLTTEQVQVGCSISNNSGNSLFIESTGIITGNVSVQPDSSVGGEQGLIQGNLALESGASFEFSPSGGLTVSGDVYLSSTFGVGNFIGLDASTADGTYTLISGTSADFASMGLQNFGSSNAYSLGQGKSAYLESPDAGVLTITVVSVPPMITSVGTASGKVGTTLTYQIVASNEPTSYAATSLPTGLTISTSTGKITGKPTKVGTFSTTVKATNAGGTGTKVVKFTIAKETTVPVLTVTTPSTLKATTTATSYTVKGKATDNISPVKVEYRIDPPTAAGYGSYKAITLSGTATSKTWSYKVATLTKGVWKVQFRALDAAGNISTVKTVTITRK